MIRKDKKYGIYFDDDFNYIIKTKDSYINSELSLVKDIRLAHPFTEEQAKYLTEYELKGTKIERLY